METFERLVQQLKKFPGVGARQARRFAYFLLRSPESYSKELIDLLKDNKQHMRLCPTSYQYFYSTNPNEKTSPIVRDPKRDASTLMIVSKDMDIEAIESTHSYQGWYFVLGGLVPIVQSRSPMQIRIDELKQHINKRGDNIQEIIFALPLTPDGEHTREHVAALLHPLGKQHNITISTLGRGLSTGTEMEYIDESTLKNALKSRS